MKIVYVNGYGGENSDKPKHLAKLLNEEVHHVRLVFGENVNVEQVYKDLEHLSPDLIIASSTGAYVVRKYCYLNNVPLVSLNPIVNIDHFEPLTKYPILKEYWCNNTIIENLILLNRDDELLDYTKAIALNGKHVMYETGGHRFSNLEEAANDITKFMYSVF